MSITNVLSGMGNSIIGNTKKALLIIPKNDEQIDTAQVAYKTATVLETASALGTQGESSALKILSLAGYHVLKVQYNPSTIAIQANAMPVPVQYLQQNIDNGIPNQNFRPPSVVMTVELVFDAVNNKDAFMFEKLRVSTGDALAAGAAIIKNLRGEGYSVQPQTNALVACLLRESTRNVIFKWSDLTFGGEVTEVSARYTMFSVSGKPIRSLVRLNITQQVNGKSDTTYWDKAFDKCFGDKYVSKESGGKSVGQNVGNLLNIGF